MGADVVGELPLYLVVGCYAATLVVTIWAFVEAVRAGTWRWAITILVLQFAAAAAWFVAGRRFYRQPPKRRRGWITEAPSAGHRRGG